MGWVILNYDLGLKGDYENLYKTLDNLGAQDCGNSNCTFDFSYSSSCNNHDDRFEELLKFFEKEVEFDFYENRLETGEMLLLCCDGLWSVLEQQKISKILRENPFLKEATAELVAAANKAGGPDNISCILVKRN